MTQARCFSFRTESMSVSPITTGRTFFACASTHGHASVGIKACVADRADQPMNPIRQTASPVARPSRQSPHPWATHPAISERARIRL